MYPSILTLKVKIQNDEENHFESRTKKVKKGMEKVWFRRVRS